MSRTVVIRVHHSAQVSQHLLLHRRASVMPPTVRFIPEHVCGNFPVCQNLRQKSGPYGNRTRSKKCAQCLASQPDCAFPNCSRKAAPSTGRYATQLCVSSTVTLPTQPIVLGNYVVTLESAVDRYPRLLVVVNASLVVRAIFPAHILCLAAPCTLKARQRFYCLVVTLVFLGMQENVALIPRTLENVLLRFVDSLVSVLLPICARLVNLNASLVLQVAPVDASLDRQLLGLFVSYVLLLP